MLESLKRQYHQEELSFAMLKKQYPHLDNMSDEEILLYFECDSRSKIIHIAVQMNTTDHKMIDNSFGNHITCSCTNADGYSKNLYVDVTEAKRMCKLLSKEQNIVLRLYICPTSDGWHLTKK